MGRFIRHVFICTNQRKEGDLRGCCAARGSMDLLGHLKKRVHDGGLKDKVRGNKAGCLAACQHGPSMVVYPDDVWYSPKTAEDMEEIFTEHLQNGRVVERLLMDFRKK